MVIINAIQSVLTILIMISIGYILTRRGWFDEKFSKIISRLVVNVSLPGMMIYNLTSSFDRNKILEIGIGFVVPFIVIASLYLISIPLASVLKIPQNRRGVFSALFSFSNAVYVGLPIAIALFGEKSVPYVTMYYIINTTLFWTIGVYRIQQDGQGVIKEKIFSKETLRRILSPTLITFFFTITIIMLNIKLPAFILDTCKYLGSLTTPVSMIFIGIIIYYIDIRGIRVNREMITIILGRFVVSPIIAFIALKYIPIPILMKKVFIIEAALPVMAQVAVVGQAYKADHKFATLMVTVTTMLSLIVIPIYMFLFSILW